MYRSTRPDGRPQTGDVTSPPPSGYRSLADLLRARMDAGDLMSGHRLPSVSTLAQTYGLAPLTVRRAIDVLSHEGRVTVRQGFPTTVREVADIEDVDVPPTRVTARMPTPQDRARWGDIPAGCPMLVALDLPDDWAGPDAWPVHRFRLRPGPPAPPAAS